MDDVQFSAYLDLESIDLGVESRSSEWERRASEIEQSNKAYLESVEVQRTFLDSLEKHLTGLGIDVEALTSFVLNAAEQDNAAAKEWAEKRSEQDPAAE